MPLPHIVHERLWGMIACHHPSPHQVDSSIRSVCELIGRNLALHTALRIYKAEAQSRQTSGELLQNYAAGIGSSKSPVDVKSLQGPQLLGLLDADGLVSRIDGVVSYHGVTVPEESLAAVLGKLRKLHVRGIASSNMLSALDRSAAAYADKASGALYLALSEQVDDYLLFLRRELVETVTWAGDPNTGVGADAAGKLHPRKSFAAWQEILRARARPWTGLELENANLLREKLLRMRDAKRLRKLEALVRHNPPANDGHRSTRR
jgi:chemotaxis family two-component system sensor kinase Cph1